MTVAYDFAAKTIDGAEKSLADYRGKPLLIVNVASQVRLHAAVRRARDAVPQVTRDSGFEVLGFPCDQFGHQEPGDEERDRRRSARRSTT